MLSACVLCMVGAKVSHQTGYGDHLGWVDEAGEWDKRIQALRVKAEKGKPDMEANRQLQSMDKQQESMRTISMPPNGHDLPAL